MSDSFKLYRLQQIDTKIDQAKARVNEIDLLINDDRRLLEAQNAYNEAKDNLENARKKLRLAEMDVQAQNLKIEQTESSLYGGKVKNPKELQDLELEVGALKRYLSVLEERLLLAMFAEEEADETFKSKSNRLETTKITSTSEHNSLTNEREALINQIAQFDNERQAAIKNISKENLDHYDQLREKRKGIAVVRLTETFCVACGSTLSTSLLYEARSPNKIAYCDTCGRILYAN